MKEGKIKAICFDMWGTLFEGGEGNEWTGLQEILKANSVNQAQFKRMGEQSLLAHPRPIEQGVKALADEFKLKVSTDTIDRAVNFWKNLVERSQIYPETLPTLEKLNTLGIKLIIMSNSDIESLDYKIKKYSLDKYFSKVFNSAQYQSLKKAGKMFESAQEFLALPKNQILMVDDSYEQCIIPARNFGWEALWLARGKEGQDRYKIEDLRGIFEYL